MIDEDKLVAKLEARIKEITDTITDDMQPLVRLLQSTRARALMDVVEAIKDTVGMAE